MQLNLDQLIEQLTRIRDKYEAGNALVETIFFKEGNGLVEEITTAKVISVDAPPKLNPKTVVINIEE